MGDTVIVPAETEGEAVAKKTKQALLEEARDLGLDPDEDIPYSELLELVKSAGEDEDEDEDDPQDEPDEPDEPEESPLETGFSVQVTGLCANCSREATVVDDGYGVANPVPFCDEHAPPPPPASSFR